MIFIEKPAAGVPEQMHASEAEGEATQDEHDSASFHPKTKNLDPVFFPSLHHDMRPNFITQKQP